MTVFNEKRAHADKWNKDRLVSRYVTEGAKSAPHRSYYYAMGMRACALRWFRVR